MACGCGKRPRTSGTFFNPYNYGDDPEPGPNGIYLFAEDDDDTEGYHGAHPAALVRYVGYGTEWERLFIRQAHGAASAYATEHHVAARVVPAVLLPHARVAELFGET